MISLLHVLFYSHFYLSACSCQGEVTMFESKKYADIVFSGTVKTRIVTKNFDSLGVKSTNKDFANSYWKDFPIAVINFQIDKIWKGKQTSKVINILTPPNGASCGYYFEIGQKYIVYATIKGMGIGSKLEKVIFDNKTFWTHQCSRTQLWNEMKIDC